jgi:hypothetical protein
MPHNDVAVPVVFPDYLIEVDTPPVSVPVPDTLPWFDILPNRVDIPKTKNKVPYLGHAGILFIDGRAGVTEYYEFGRYGGPLGKVMKRQLPNVRMASNGRPTRASLEHVLAEVSAVAGQHGRITGAYIELPSGAFIKMHAFAVTAMKKNTDPKRVPYGLLTNSCLHFMKETAEAGGARLPAVVFDTPKGYMFQIQLEEPDLDFQSPGTLACRTSR